MGLMITDDGANDDSDAVSDNNDLEGGHYSNTWTYFSVVNCLTFSTKIHLTFTALTCFIWRCKYISTNRSK